MLSVNVYAQEKNEEPVLEQIEQAVDTEEITAQNDEEELSSEQVALLMEQINDNMNTLNVELDLTRQAYDYLIKEYDALKEKYDETQEDIKILKLENERTLKNKNIHEANLRKSKTQLKEKENQMSR